MRSTKPIFFTLLLSLMTSNLTMAADNDTVWIFGYGSLMSTLARTATAADAEGAEYLPVKVHDMARKWNLWIAKASQRALNIEVSPGDSVNGLLFGVKTKDLPAFDLREGAYNRVKIAKDKVSFYREDHRNKVFGTDNDAEIYAYLPKSEFYVGPEDTEKKIAMSYLNIVRSGCVEVDQTNNLNGQFIMDCHQTLGLEEYDAFQDEDQPTYIRHPKKLLNKAEQRVDFLKGYLEKDWPNYLEIVRKYWGF
ncbi:gamma-glutamylcyclotransferase [Salinisphaera sp. G21_0]|uniref:gamma-glutamylcyclotransferase family protein n=1 Tax=Salinisphaera sp. G21_0 TaxID=2821094 RepID=UPI001ADB5017|nr:gamma-glutamylcyclotransferase [Salinisphaera sp. G21_0]MBO9484059.1 gamma-glutamylcyclotransferase [Salinisphaera sp. G21_0]